MRLKSPTIGVCILAGGLSSRMGVDKTRLLLGRKTMISRIKAAARSIGRVRVIRRDNVKRCGPLGGLLTGLQNSTADAEIFLACDMPFISAALLEQFAREYQNHGRPMFITANGLIGFPCLLPIGAVAIVQDQIVRREFSVEDLARRLRARRLRLSSARAAKELVNLNTMAEMTGARAMLREISRLPNG